MERRYGMATREAFIQELEGLNQELNAMSQMVQDAIDSSFQALTEHNEELAQKVIKGDRDVGQYGAKDRDTPPDADVKAATGRQ